MNTARFASQLLNVRVLWPFLLATICVAIFGDMVEEALKQWIAPRVPHVILTPIIIAVCAVVFFWLAVILFKRQVYRLTQAHETSLKEESPHHYRGLILLVSQIEPCRQAIHYHQPILERVWLICSTLTKPKADALRQEFPTLIDDEPIIINNVYQPSEVKHQVNEIYRRLPDDWQAEDVIADCTGMTAQCSIGLMLACWGQQRPLQYTPAIVDEEGKIIGSGNPIEIRLEETLSSERRTP